MAKRKIEEPYIDSGRAEKMLMDWVNLPDVLLPQFRPAVAKLTSSYPDICKDKNGLALAQQLWPAANDCRIGWIYGVREHLRAVWDASGQHQRDVAEQYIFRMRNLYGTVVREHLAANSRPTLEAVLEGITVKSALHRMTGDEIENMKSSPAEKTQWRTEDGFPTLDRIFLRGRLAGMLLDPPFPTTMFDLIMRYLKGELRRALRCANSDCPSPYFLRTVHGQRYCDPGGDCFETSRANQKTESRERRRGRPAKKHGRPRKY